MFHGSRQVVAELPRRNPGKSPHAMKHFARKARPPTTRLRTLAQASEAHIYALRALNRSEATIRVYQKVHEMYRTYLKEQGRAEPVLADLSLAHARGFVLWLKTTDGTNPIAGTAKPRSSHTVHSYANALKIHVNWLLAEGLLTSDPLARFKLPKYSVSHTDLLSKTQVADFMRAIERHHDRGRNLALYFLLLDTGLRAEEVCSLNVGAVDLKGRLTVMGKGRKERMVPFDPATGKVLGRYLAERSKPAATEPLFLSRYGVRLTTGALRSVTKRIGDSAGIEGAHPHMFRVLYATWFLIAHPHALLQLQENLGHTDLKMVRLYAKRPEQMRTLTGPTVIQSLELERLTKQGR